MESAVIARPLWNSCYLLARFSVYVCTLFGLKKIYNFYEFKYLHPNQTFSNFHNKIVHFFHHFCWTAVKSGRELATATHET
jgi:hypothetical protein